MNTTERKELALQLHREGHNCCQCVIAAFGDRLGEPAAVTAVAAAAGMGGGVGGQGQICGAVSAIAMLRGLLRDSSPADKPRVYADVRQLSDRFLQRNGSITCRELRSRAEGIAHKPCSEYIADAIDIFDNYISQ